MIKMCWDRGVCVFDLGHEIPHSWNYVGMVE